jgi:hypothetical protein
VLQRSKTPDEEEEKPVSIEDMQKYYLTILKLKSIQALKTYKLKQDRKMENYRKSS